MKKILGTVVTIGSSIALAAPAFATTFVDSVTVDTAPVMALATVIVTALAGVWGIRKVIKLVNRS